MARCLTLPSSESEMPTGNEEHDLDGMLVIFGGKESKDHMMGVKSNADGERRQKHTNAQITKSKCDLNTFVNLMPEQRIQGNNLKNKGIKK